ncbi:hypothetical protein BATDEDRAFT_90590 [Batrachochytrium dendrobatidis JAM81]|uniref:Histone deacetylase complex subunit SAP30 Sin3 binding domain-containing protein n=1 Tax=Batrachochytrium dendrobatidis (strain JAM81 / FGSC 10211) TaxID=684364 RepID=F4P7X9_BATDJ|nr:uncharacterized protein BATDEDRAFT_90590 [Batrachochytrium dendrobatidis JAM81]EGF78651.1 hypothetical protein BATDEDRAFT_90590 [Batrachochytrium dendrobatidis JAM81]|eukprot:XP_006680927.1 hypothetical protein BATDEDRAFT_90590 [Batrachochytrium dendrobatidis JAM81]
MYFIPVPVPAPVPFYIYTTSIAMTNTLIKPVSENPTYPSLDFSLLSDHSLLKYGKIFDFDSNLLQAASSLRASPISAHSHIRSASTPIPVLHAKRPRGRPSKSAKLVNINDINHPVQTERDALVDAVANHFHQHEIDEANVLANFLYSINHRDKKLRLPPQMMQLRQSFN